MNLAQFKLALHAYLIGENETLVSVFKFDVFFNDLVQAEKLNAAGLELTNADVLKYGGQCYHFIQALCGALEYRAANADTVKNMQADNPKANFGDKIPGTTETLKGGTDNPWDSIKTNTLSKAMRKCAHKWINNLKRSISMGGNGYDYRPSKGVLFHIKK